MSGEKRTPIQILQDEIRENRSQLYDIQQQRSRLKAELQNTRKENIVQLNKLRQEMQSRDQQQATVLKQLKSDLRDIAFQHTAQLKEQRDQMMQSMHNLEQKTNLQISDLRTWTRERLAEQQQEYKQMMQQQQQQINTMKQDIATINLREDNRTQRAKDYISDLKTLIYYVDTCLPHERFAPGRLNKIKQQLSAAERLLQEDVSPAAIATIQAAHFILMDLEEDVLHKEAEFEMTYRTVADTIEGLLIAVRKNRQIQLEDNATVQEADFWTEGRYSNLEHEIEEVQRYIADNKQQLTTDGLNIYLDEISELNKQQEQLIQEAVERIISSQLRAEMGDVVIEKLSQQGYRIKETGRGYAEDDQRRSYMIKMANVAGTEIVTVIQPDKETYQNILSVNTFNEDPLDDAAKRNRNNDILAALKEGGLQPGETLCNDVGIEAFYDVEHLIKKGKQILPGQVVQQAEKLSSLNQRTNDK